MRTRIPFFVIPVFIAIVLFAVFSVFHPVLAAPIESASPLRDFQLQIPLPGFDPQTAPIIETDGNTVRISGIGLYVAAIYSWLNTVVGIIAVISLMYGGVLWLTAGGNKGNIQKSQDIIQNALVGMGLLLGSYLILYTIDPGLVVLNPLSLGEKIADPKLSIPLSLPSFGENQQSIGNSGVEPIRGTACTGAMKWHTMYSGLTAQDIDQILQKNGSPMAGAGAAIVQSAQKYNIDPALGLAFWRHESGFGKLGVATVTRNPGNITASAGEMRAGKGVFVKDRNWLSYQSWSDGGADWFRYINLYTEPQYQTVAGILKPYAPPSENDLKAYIDSVCSALVAWSKDENKSAVKQQCGCR